LWRSGGPVPSQLKLLYLGDGTSVTDAPDEAALEATERKVLALWSAIAEAVDRRDFRPRPSRLCDWCDHRSRCPEFGGQPPPLPLLSLIPASPSSPAPSPPPTPETTPS
jgi:putative RecB family exonuclease